MRYALWAGDDVSVRHYQPGAADERVFPVLLNELYYI